VQFESIHPVLAGNGRIGRLLIALYLVTAGVMRQPLFYLSLYLRRRRADDVTACCRRCASRAPGRRGWNSSSTA
jgi:Fic family protein